MKMNATNLVMAVLAIFLLYMLMNGGPSKFMSMGTYMKKEYFTLEGAPIESTGSFAVPTNLQSALLPNEIPVTEDFAQFNTDFILSNQNYLDPRNQIGYPETVGGVLRNSNLQIRSEPANPRDPVSIFNLSTIAPEQMRPQFEITQ